MVSRSRWMGRQELFPSANTTIETFKTRHSRIQALQLILILFVLIIPFDALMTLLIAFLPARMRAADAAAAVLLLISYPLLTWKRLSDLLAGQVLFERTHPWKVIAAAVAVVGLSTLAPLVDGRFPQDIVVSFTLLFLLSFICGVPAKQLKSIELKRNAGFWEFVPEAFQFLLWPLGVLWIQPRINRILERKITIRE